MGDRPAPAAAAAPATGRAWLADATGRLREAGVGNAAQEARWLVQDERARQLADQPDA